MKQNRVLYCICDITNKRFLSHTILVGHGPNGTRIYAHRFDKHVSDSSLASKRRMIERLQSMKEADVYTQWDGSTFEPFCLEVKKVRISYAIDGDTR